MSSFSAIRRTKEMFANKQHPLYRNIFTASSFGNGSWNRNCRTNPAGNNGATYQNVADGAPLFASEPSLLVNFNEPIASPVGWALESNLVNTTFGQDEYQAYTKSEYITKSVKRFSLCCWMRSVGAWQNRSALWGIMDGLPAGGGISFGYESANNLYLSASTRFWGRAQTLTMPAQDEWFFLAGSFDADLASNNLKIWLNGTPGTFANNTNDISYNEPSSRLNPFHPSATTTGSPCNTAIANAVAWDGYALTHDDVQMLYHSMGSDLFNYKDPNQWLAGASNLTSNYYYLRQQGAL